LNSNLQAKGNKISFVLLTIALTVTIIEIATQSVHAATG
jgi:hypothetical protein